MNHLHSNSTGEDFGANEAVSIYEVHLDSWRRVVEEQNRPLTCAEIAPKLAAYVKQLNFTHVEILSTAPPLPKDLTGLVHDLSDNDLGVVLDALWSPGGADNWDRAWATDTLAYLSHNPMHRPYHHGQIRGRNRAELSGNLVLALSHELVSNGQPSLLARMPGDDWQKFANLRLLLADLFVLPGRKLIFMGGEFGQWNGWNPQGSLDWHLVEAGNFHGKLEHWVADLNRVYRREPALHQTGPNPGCFEWIDTSEAEESCIGWLRRGRGQGEIILGVFNFTPAPRHNYRVGVPGGGFWKELLNSDAVEYGGSGQGNLGGVEAAPFGWHGQSHSLTVTLPPLGAVFFKQFK